MSMDVTEVEKAMLALDRHDIAALVHRGIQALDQGGTEVSQDEIDAAWRDELAHRIDGIRNGKIETVPLEESFARARAAIAAMRK